MTVKSKPFFCVYRKSIPKVCFCTFVATNRQQSMEIYNGLTDGGEDNIVEVVNKDSSYNFEELPCTDDITLIFSLTEYVDFVIGAYVYFLGTKYVMHTPSKFTKISEREYEYTLTFESPSFSLKKYKFFNVRDGRVEFVLTAKPHEFLQHIVDNLNERESGWTVGDYIDSVEKTQAFSHNSILEALQSVASLFNTEFEVKNKRISLRKVEYYNLNPLRLSYGKGNGFKSGITRQLSGDNDNAVDVLWVKGGERNINSATYKYEKDGAEYSANKLHLPVNQTFFYVPPVEPDMLIDPQNSTEIDKGYIYTQAEWNAIDEGVRPRNFMEVYTDKDGYRVCRRDKVNDGFEDSLDCSDIYPKKVCTAMAVTNSVPEQYMWEVYDIDNDVDYTQYLIGTQKPTLIFESGMLSGKEFEFYYRHSERQFEIQPTEIDGMKMPNTAASGFIPKIGDKFAVFHVALPSEYITLAEREMLLEGCNYLYKHGEIGIEFQGEIDGIWAERVWESIGSKIILGGTVRFTDNVFCKDGKDIRITAIKRYLNKPYQPELTLSNTTVAQSVSSELKQAAKTEVVIRQEEIQSGNNYTRRGFESAKETSDQLGAEFDSYKESNDKNVESIGKTANKAVNEISTVKNDFKNGITAAEKAAKEYTDKQVGNEEKRAEDALAAKALELARDTNNKIALVAKDLRADYTGNITPFTIKTMHILVGNESLAFEFGWSNATTHEELITSWQRADYNLIWDSTNQELVVNPIQLRHLVYTNYYQELIPDMSKVKYPYWYVPAGKATPKEGEFYFIYLKCHKMGTNPVQFNHLTGDTQHPQYGAEVVLKKEMTDHTDTYYYFLLGTLGTDRSIGTLYGFTEVGGNKITTGVIRSQSGDTVIDLDNDIVRGRFDFKDGLITQDLVLEGGTAGVGGANEDYAFWAGNNLMNDSYFRVWKNGRLEVRDNLDFRVFAAYPDTHNVYIHNVRFERAGSLSTDPTNVYGKLTFKSQGVTFDSDIQVNGKFVANSLTAIKEFIPIAGKFNHSGVLSIHGESVKSGYSFGRSAQGYYGLTVNSTGDLRDCLCLATVNNVTLKKGNGSQMYAAACVFYENGNTEIWFQVGDDASANDLNEDDINREVHFALLRCSKLWNL